MTTNMPIESSIVSVGKNHGQETCGSCLKAWRILSLGAWAGIILIISGCVATTNKKQSNSNPADLRSEAIEVLKAAIRYQANPVVRVEAVEALARLGSEEAKPWIRSALLDEHPAVRFAACTAIGVTKDALATDAVNERTRDDDPSVRVSAWFARHRLGYTNKSGLLASALLDHSDPTVRRNAALLLGLLEEPAAIKLLAKAMKDGDVGVRHHALEAMARLGNRDAKQELAFLINSGVGTEEVFALNALAETRDRAYLETFRYKLATAPHVETKLAAAKGLGMLGNGDGLPTALTTLRIPKTQTTDRSDRVEDQVLRQRQLALNAIAAIGKTEALPDLTKALRSSNDPRIQVAAAQAVLLLLQMQRSGIFPVSQDAAPG